MRRAEVPEQRVDAPWGCRCGATNCKGARQCEAPGGGAFSEPSRSPLGTFPEPSCRRPGAARGFASGVASLATRSRIASLIN